MRPLHMPREATAQAGQSLAAGLPPSRTRHAKACFARRAARRWPCGPSLTAAAPAAGSDAGRGRKTPLQPNRKTMTDGAPTRTDHALQKADIFTRHRQPRSPARSCCRGLPESDTTRSPPNASHGVVQASSSPRNFPTISTDLQSFNGAWAEPADQLYGNCATQVHTGPRRSRE